MTAKQAILHGVALALAVDPDGPLIGIVLTGAPGIGKSSVAVSLTETCPWRRTRLVSDDIIALDRRDDSVWGKAPERISGLIEVRGVGLVKVPVKSEVKIALVFTCQNEQPERLPAAQNMAVEVAEGDAMSLPKFPIWLAPRGARDVASQIRFITRAVLAGQIVS